MKQQLLIDNASITIAENGYLSLSNLAKMKDAIRPKLLIQYWLQSKSTLHLLTVWEKLHNPDFDIKGIEEHLFNQTITPEVYLQKTNGIVMVISENDVFVPREIALSFCHWLDPTLFLLLDKALKNNLS